MIIRNWNRVKIRDEANTVIHSFEYIFYRYDWIENKLAHIGRLDNSMFSSDSRWTKASVISEELLEHPLVG